MLFCPSCANLLLIENEDGQDFFCQTCPYTYNIQKRVIFLIELNGTQSKKKSILYDLQKKNY